MNLFDRRVLAPSDINRYSPESLRVGGRVLSVDALTVVIGDAFSTLRVQLAEATPLQPGFLVVLDGTWNSNVLGNSVVVWSQAAPASAGDGEFARFSWNHTGKRLQKCAHALRVLRDYFQAEQFLEVCTPTRLRAPGLDAHVEPIATQEGWLVTSPELHLKRLLVGGISRVFELARCHRDEELGRYHEPEFTLLEWYRAFEPVESVMRDTETLVTEVVVALSGKRTVIHNGTSVLVSPPFHRLSVSDAFVQFAQREDALELAAKDPDTWFRIWVEKVEPGIATLDRPVFIVDYPISQAAMARPSPGDPRAAERFELYCAGVELCNGYGELTDAHEQRSRMEAEVASRVAQGQTALPVDERFLAALHEGLPPCSGNALGFDRLMMLATGAEALADVVGFPWNRN